ncbi:MAG: hypothetical protein P8Y54_05260 [Xanthomonadales bacterium]
MRRFAVLLLLVFAAPLAAQSVESDAARQVHWATAAFFGTGWYRVSANREAFIFRVPPRQVLREPVWDGSGARTPGIEILYPVAFGLHRLEDAPDFIDFDNYGTVTFTPGVAVEIPMSERWRLRPHAHFGLGYERSSGEWARIYYGGVRSHYTLAESDGRNLALLGSVSLAGYKPDYEGRGHYGSALVGFEGSTRSSTLTLGGAPARLNGHLTYSYMFDEMEFHIGPQEVVTVRDEWELGLALAREGGKIGFGFIGFEQIGLAYKWSSNGAYRAITVNLRSPFTR